MNQEVFDYYQSIIPDSDVMPSCWLEPLVQSLWVNPNKISVDAFIALLAQDGISFEPIAWHPYGLRYKGEQSIAKHWTYAAGFFQLQEEVSMLSGLLLGAKPGDVALDLCAAPGNKSAQMAVMMQNTGTLVVNDVSHGRMRAFGQMMKRLGIINASTTTMDARSYPNVGEYFDKIMVDAPCTCEGTLRKNLNKQTDVSSSKKSRVFASRQLEILLKAIKLAKPGAEIMYSTCTFSPIENEGVVSAALEQTAGVVELLPLTCDSLVYSPGVTQWHGDQYHDSVRHCMRLWPHQNNTGGFFLAKFRKCVSNNKAAVTAKTFADDGLNDYHAEIYQRYGIADHALVDLQFFRGSRKGIYVCNRDNAPPSTLAIDATGVLFLKTNMQFPKLSTAAAMLFGLRASTHIVDITDQQRQQYLNKQDLELTADQVQGYSTGYVLVRYKQFILGLGLYFEPNEQHEHVLRSLFRMGLI